MLLLSLKRLLLRQLECIVALFGTLKLFLHVQLIVIRLLPLIARRQGQMPCGNRTYIIGSVVGLLREEAGWTGRFTNFYATSPGLSRGYAGRWGISVVGITLALIWDFSNHHSNLYLLSSPIACCWILYFQNVWNWVFFAPSKYWWVDLVFAQFSAAVSPSISWSCLSTHL